MSAEGVITRTWQVGRWTVTLTVPPLVRGAVRHAHAEWTPSMPDRPLTPAEQHQYETGLQAALGSMARAES